MLLSKLFKKKLNYFFCRILIVDFDVHHGDGTQDITYDKENVMYISMHRFDKGNFFPKDHSGGYDRVGEKAAAGFNANIAFDNVRIWF